jgi:hypothetical protein
MRRSIQWSVLTAAAATASVATVLTACGAMGSSSGSKNDLGFFVTSANPGKGGDLGGVAGADKYCQTLASAVGAGDKTWRAYLSTQPSGGTPGTNARDRIGKGPWKNAKGVVVATDVANLHSADNNLNKQTALTEKGDVVNGRGDTPNTHDMLTGSQPDGTFIAGDANSTCGNWTMSSGGAAMVGHHDRMGLNESAPMKSWNSSHQTRGCSLDELKTTGSGGLFYCFAAN